jgi:hypothetical protein
MDQVADMPDSDRSDDESEEEEEESDEEDDGEGEGVADKPQFKFQAKAKAPAPAAEPTPAPADTDGATASLEQLRLHKALGNDGAPGEELPEEEDPYYLSDSSSSSSAASDAGTDYTQYIRPARAPRARPSVAAVSTLGGIDELKTIVAGDIARTQRGGAHHHTKRLAVGRAKGTKWKNNAAYVTGSKGESGWD